MHIREVKRFWEEWEEKTLFPFATLSTKSKGRERWEEECTLRNCFQRDRDRVLHSKSFRRLKHKSQVFLSPEGDHYRTRLTHTLEVSQISRTIARGLRLNEDLVEAISLGHDLGHTPFGHAGEEALQEVHPGGFKHNLQSLRVVEVLENSGRGLNLTWEVRDGIARHSKTRDMSLVCTSDDLPATLEGQVVRWADVIAYVNHDIDDAIRAGVIRDQDLPVECVLALGRTHRDRIDQMVKDIIIESYHTPFVLMSATVREATETLRRFMFEKVYFGDHQLAEREKAKRLIKELYSFFSSRPDILKDEYLFPFEEREIGEMVCDFVSGMTDRFALSIYRKYFIPSPWPQGGA
ncbi:MAG: deoxyguanosinetriphosphate triphosphohydrolase [Candidatus Atribacteria bacterium]|nr:deoxyguanosinetriphosphate triphosphohydrolase [Candidatus Atribacteria bacterium]